MPSLPTPLRRPSLMCALLIAAVIMVLLPPTPASAIAATGRLPMSVLLCKFADDQVELKSAEFFRNMFTPEGRGKGGLEDFVSQQSGGRVTTEGTQVRGWYTMPITFEQWRDKSLTEQRDDCVRAAREQSGYQHPDGQPLAMMINTEGGVAAYPPTGQNWFMLSLGRWTVKNVVEAVLRVHGLSAAGTYLIPPTEFFTWHHGWDATTASAAVFAAPSDYFGQSTVGLSGPHLDELGWIPRDRILALGKDGIGTRTVRLAPLERPDLPGTQLIRIPSDPANTQRYYTVEFRKKTGVSAGIPNDSVLIHYYDGRAGLLQQPHPWRPLQALNHEGVSIRVDSQTADSATVTVSTSITTACLPGSVHRRAAPDDIACVTPEVRDQAAADTRDHPNRIDAEGRCLPGYTHRLTTPGDRICVTPLVKQRVLDDTNAAPARTNPARNNWGPNVCAGDNVWRGTDEADHVCVPMSTRLQVLEDNAAAPSRWVNGPWGPKSCPYGFVWRDAFIGDLVCVTVDRRAQAHADNRTAKERVQFPSGG